MAYDIIGDIHGQANKLHSLLAHMGYEDRDGAYRHSDRTAIFVGDFIDKGPQQLESVMTVRRMIDAGTAQAVMGNHEFNAIAWHTPDPAAATDYLRQRNGSWGDGNRKQHAAFLKEVEGNQSLHKEVIRPVADLAFGPQHSTVGGVAIIGLTTTALDVATQQGDFRRCGARRRIRNAKNIGSPRGRQQRVVWRDVVRNTE